MTIIKKTVLFYIFLTILCCKTYFIRIFAMSNRKTLSINEKKSFMKKMKFVAAKVKKIIKEGLNENGKNYMMYPYNF